MILMPDCDTVTDSSSQKFQIEAVLSEGQGSVWLGLLVCFSMADVVSPPVPSSLIVWPSISLQPTLLVDRRQIDHVKQMPKEPQLLTSMMD